jgi:ArsR family transcriptional regulator
MCHGSDMPDVREELIQLHSGICKGLADPKRLLIIDTLGDGEMSVMDICSKLDFAQANVSQHLAILREGGLVESRRDGQRVYYWPASSKIIEAIDLLREVMADQLAVTR